MNKRHNSYLKLTELKKEEMIWSKLKPLKLGRKLIVKCEYVCKLFYANHHLLVFKHFMSAFSFDIFNISLSLSSLRNLTRSSTRNIKYPLHLFLLKRSSACARSSSTGIKWIKFKFISGQQEYNHIAPPTGKPLDN